MLLVQVEDSVIGQRTSGMMAVRTSGPTLKICPEEEKMGSCSRDKRLRIFIHYIYTLGIFSNEKYGRVKEATLEHWPGTRVGD